MSPARAWARFVRAAGEGLPARPLAASDARDGRAAFYTGLADELDAGADGRGLRDGERSPKLSDEAPRAGR